MRTEAIQALLIVVGAVAIIGAMIRTRALMTLVPEERRASWSALRAMIAFFVLGYFAAAWLILAELENVLGWLVGVVFLGGATFVYVVVTMSVGSLRELTATSHSREAFQITLDTVVDAILTIDERGIVLFANSGTEKMFGYSVSELIGKNVKMLMTGVDVDQHDAYVRRYVEGGEPRVIGIGREVVGRRKDATTFPAELVVSEMRVHGERRFVGSLRDISERKEVDRMKSEFISIVSHELRTPLTSIRGSLGLLVGGVGGELSDKGQNLLEIGVRSCDRLVRLINDILDIEKIESRAIQMNLSDVLLDRVVATACDASRGFAGEHGVGLEVSVIPELLVRADEDRIVQVLTNLVSNAIKFSPEGETVRVVVGLDETRARVTVSDRGPGIPETFRPRIFEKFAQADSSSTRKIPGSGLGLSISKAIVDQHGGQIGYETSGQGTSFFFDLEARQRSRARTTDSRTSTHAAILICEDDEDLAGVLAEAFDREGVACDVAFDARQAKELLALRSYDALFLDLFLPGQDGISLIRELRGQESTRELPIVVVSAAARDGKKRLGGAFQVVDWIEKPFDHDRLRAALASATRKSEGRPQILHVEDDLDVAAVVRGYLEPSADIHHAASLDAARAALAESQFDLALLDLALGDGNGLELIAELSDTQVVVFSAHDVPEEARASLAAVLSKGATSGDELRRTVLRVLSSDDR